MMDIATERRITAVEDRSKSNGHRLDKLEERQSDLEKLVTSVATLTTELTHMKDDVTEVKNDVVEVKGDIKRIADKPGKRWENIVDKVFGVLVGALITYFLVKLGIQ